TGYREEYLAHGRAIDARFRSGRFQAPTYRTPRPDPIWPAVWRPDLYRFRQTADNAANDAIHQRRPRRPRRDRVHPIAYGRETSATRPHRPDTPTAGFAPTHRAPARCALPPRHKAARPKG